MSSLEAFVSIFLLVAAQLAYVGLASAAFAGGLYFIDNNPTSNSLLVYGLNGLNQGDGQPIFVNGYKTGGRGSPVQNHADSLSTQDSVAVAANGIHRDIGPVVAAVNPGSNDVSMFSIDQQDPTALTLLSVVPSGFAYPISLNFNPKGNILCVLCGGGDQSFQDSGIRCYTVDKTGLTTLPSWDRPLTLTGSASDIIFSADGRLLFVIAKMSNGLFVYTVSSDGIALEPIIYNTNGVYDPFSLTLIGQSSMLVTDVHNPVVNVFEYDSSNGTTTAASGLTFDVVGPENGAICWSAYSPITKTYFVLAYEGGIFELNASSTSISLIQSFPVSVGSALDGIVSVINGTAFLYVLTPPYISSFVLSSSVGIPPITLQPQPVPKPYARLANQGMATYVPTALAASKSVL